MNDSNKRRGCFFCIILGMLYTYESPLCLPAYKAMNDTQVAAELALPCLRTNLLFEYEAFEVRQRCFLRRFYIRI